MTAQTHITFAEFIYLLILTTAGVSLNLANAFVIAISSLLPDIDTAVSTIGRIAPFISTKLERKFSHRTITHSVIFIIALGLLALPLYAYSASLYACFMVGYASHPILDTMTVTGVKLFHPFSSVKCVFPFEVNNPHRYRMQTGSKSEKMLAVIFLVGCIPAFLIAYQGYERFVRATQQNIESAVRDYNEFSKDHLVFARVEGYNALTKAPLSGTIEIIGALNPHVIVFKGADGHLHTAGREFQADYAVDNILCSKGDTAHASVRNVDMSNQLLAQLGFYVDTSGENYFFGNLTTADKVSLPENIKMFTPVTGSGGSIKLNFATYDDIKALENVFITKGIITIKSISIHQPATSAVAALPRLENFTQISVACDAKESITFLKAKGDTVQSKELIARKNLAQFYEDEISLNEEKIHALESQSVTALSDNDEKISNAEQRMHIDSIEYEHNLELSRKQYISGAILESSRLEWSKAHQVLEGLISSGSAHRSKTEIDIQKLRIQNAELEAKARSAELQSEIRSTIKGVLIDIRQVPHDNKTQITFIIRRIP